LAVETAYRISAWDTPLRVNPNRTGARFNVSGSPATQYLCLHPLGPWAEYLRFHNLRDGNALGAHRLRLWAVRVDLTDALEITFATAERYGLLQDELTDDSYDACRRLADRLRHDASAPKQIVVPSAALPGTRNVIIFGERIGIPFDWPPLGSIDLPTDILADQCSPPTGITELVRYRGQPNPELVAWEEGRRFRFEDHALR
jgi:RES domain-containing protein